MTGRQKMIIAWVAFLVGWVVIFAAMEGYALMYPEHGITLSRFVWEVSAAWPPFPFFAGFAAGFLACHFWWGGIVPFAPPKSRSPDHPRDHRG